MSGAEGESQGFAVAKGRDIDLAPPPRSLSVAAQLTALFGGTSSQVGWGLLCFSLIFFWIFAVNSEAVTLVEFLGQKSQTQGRVTNIRQTGAEENEEPVLAVDFTYAVDGTDYEGTSYGHGTPAKGASVPVEYLSGRPHRARIEGMRVRTFGAFGVLVIIFPLAGVFLIVTAMRTGARQRRLLRIGKVGYGSLVGKEATGTTVNEQPEFKLTYELIVPPAEQFGTYREKWASWAETHRFHIKTYEIDRVTDEANEPVLYDPDRPGDATLIDALHDKLRLSHRGISGGTFVHLLLPLLTVVLHGLWLLVVLA